MPYYSSFLSFSVDRGKKRSRVSNLHQNFPPAFPKGYIVRVQEEMGKKGESERREEMRRDGGNRVSQICVSVSLSACVCITEGEGALCICKGSNSLAVSGARNTEKITFAVFRERTERREKSGTEQRVKGQNLSPFRDTALVWRATCVPSPLPHSRSIFILIKRLAFSDLACVVHTGTPKTSHRGGELSLETRARVSVSELQFGPML